MIELTKEYIDNLRNIITEKDDAKIKEILHELYPADIAELYKELDLQEAIYLNLLMDGEKAADVLMELDEEDRHKLLKELPNELIAKRFVDNMETVPVLLAAAACMLVSMNDMAAPSVSLEGRSLWLAQSLPVTAWQVLRAKLRMHLLLSGLPAALLFVCLAVVCPFPAAQTALMLAVAALFTVLSALLNLFLGLKMPILHWTNEITPIKQSGAVTIALFGGWTMRLCWRAASCWWAGASGLWPIWTPSPEPLWRVAWCSLSG